MKDIFSPKAINNSCSFDVIAVKYERNTAINEIWFSQSVLEPTVNAMQAQFLLYAKCMFKRLSIDFNSFLFFNGKKEANNFVDIFDLSEIHATISRKKNSFQWFTGILELPFYAWKLRANEFAYANRK